VFLFGATRIVPDPTGEFASNLVFQTPLSININADVRCAPIYVATNNVGVCSSQFYSWIPEKNYTLTQVTVTVQLPGGNNGECELHLLQDDWTDAFATTLTVAGGLDFDATVAAGTRIDFAVDVDITEGAPVGFFIQSWAGASDCAAGAGNDPDILVSLYGWVTN
jgi:hypothetical protein